MKQKVLLTGASGFIGQEILQKLLEEGYQVRAAARNPKKWQKSFPDVDWIEADFEKNHDPAFWTDKLKDIDIVINAAGIIRQTKTSSFENIHHKGPVALFTAAKNKKIIQISALGADERGVTPYHLSKKAADDFLLGNHKNPVIFRPSIVSGNKGQSSWLFSLLSSLPVAGIPGDGNFLIQPVTSDDLSQAVINVIKKWPAKATIAEAVGPVVFSLKSWLLGIRESMGLARPFVISVPMVFINLVAGLGIGLLDKDTLTMLKQGSVSTSPLFAKILGKTPQNPLDLWRGKRAVDFLLPLLLPVMRFSLAFIWIYTGIISAFVYPQDKSFELLLASGVPADRVLLSFLLYAASALDIVLGIGVFSRFKSLFYLLQFSLILVYTGILTGSPLWAHPFGPIAKNIPLLALVLAGFFLDQKQKK